MMAKDMVALRRRVLTVEAENQLLRTEVRLHQDLDHSLVEHQDVTTGPKVKVTHLIGRFSLEIKWIKTIKK